MSLLKKPSELVNSVVLSGIIYGQPGVGKTTLALSSPNPVIIDTDKGLGRVEKRFQVPSLQPSKYGEIVELFNSDELFGFDTIVFDTLGKLVDMMCEHACEHNSKLRQGDGTMSLKGWGAVRVQFQNLLRMARQKNKNIIFVAHEKEEKDGESVKKRPDCSGSAGKDLVKDMDFMGYMEMSGSKRTISFTPSEKFYAKNSLKLPTVIEIPSTDKGNDFIKTVIIGKTIERMKEDNEQNKRYEAVVKELAGVINSIGDVETANEALKAVNEAEVIWDSQRVAKAKLNERTKELGLVYDKETKSFMDGGK